jgi:DNA helicase-2/ATP-dependent DNA helicase PcrA
MLKQAANDKKLNPEQLQAVQHGEGPLLIIAGAGTGKTTVITERIKWLIEEGYAGPSEILALTFTEKAAREMEERIDVAMPYGYTQMWISTFHSFCDRILKLEALQIGLDPNYHLMTESEATQFLRKNFFKFNLQYFRPLGNPTKFVSGLLQHFSRLKDEDASPSEYLAWASKYVTSNKDQVEDEKLEAEKYQELANIYKSYEELRTKEGVMDFSDLISNALKLFRTRPNILKTYQSKFKYILVDEFQDTNYAQNELVILLAGKKQNLTVVADDDQAVYRFRGAAVSNVIQFRSTFPKAKIITLTRNYRSTQEILDRAYDLIQHNNPDRLEVKEKIDKKLTSERKIKGEPVTWIHRNRVENEADAVAGEIKKLTGSYSYKDIAILVRANNHSDAFARALSRHGIPFQFLGPGQLFRQEEIRDLIAYLKVLDNLEDDISFFRLLSIPIFGLSARDIATLTNFSKKYNAQLFETCEFALGLPSRLQEKNILPPFISPKTKEIVEKITKMIHRHLELLPKETGGQILYFFLEDSGTLKTMIDPQSEKAEREAQNISRFFDKLKSYEAAHVDASVHAIIDWIDLASEMGESPLAADFDWTQNDAVSILTVHSAKGLEFPAVFLVNLVSQRFPTIERREQIPIPDSLVKEILPEGDYHLEEERRLFYVGLTRAKDRLFLTSADYYGEGKREKKISPFVFETLGEKTVPQTESNQVPQLSLLEWAKAPEPVLVSQPLKVSYLSYSQIDTFELCPLHYKLKYLLKIQTPPTAAQSMGTSIHKTLHDFYYQKIQGEPIDNNTLLSILKNNWISEGYSSREHEEGSLMRVRKFLQDYYRTQYRPDQKPLLLEENFAFPLGAVKIGGKMDRVDDLGNGTIEIIDYKSGGKVPDQKVIDKDFQMTLYAMAATRIPTPPFNKKPQVVKLSFYYFEEAKKISTIRTEKDFSFAEEKINEIVHQIESSDFRCSGSQFCLTCEYKMLCNPGAVNNGQRSS